MLLEKIAPRETHPSGRDSDSVWDSFIQGYEFVVIQMLSCYSHESCGHVERLEWLAWFVLGYLNGFL